MVNQTGYQSCNEMIDVTKMLVFFNADKKPSEAM